ncbi:MAG: hypothetical protein JNM14_12245 [Ferruginibacter sp.]|nr:hypothetical protein [Ferruginibacter sp.]
MRYSSLFFIAILFLTACNKDKYTTAPQIEYKSISPNASLSTNNNCNIPDKPVLTIHVTDAEGDLGFISNKDTAYVFVKNLVTNKLDSIRFTDIGSAAVKNFSGDVEVSLCRFLSGIPGPGPKTDTLYFEVYVRDFAKNVSNTITTKDPVYYITP